MIKLSIVILTKNEEKNILDCIESVLGADEIIVVDDYSQDRTEEIVKNLNKPYLRLVKRSLDNDFAAQRNFGLSKTKNDWVLFVDVDERVSKELFLEIKQKIASSNSVAFWIKRRDFMWGKELKHGEAGNVRLVRLGQKKAGKWVGKVHETWNISGNIGQLNSELIHFPHPTIAEFLREVNAYSTIRAEELNSQGIKVNLWEIVAYPKAKFFLNYFIRFGFVDGVAGFVVALMMSLHSFLVRAKLWRLYQK